MSSRPPRRGAPSRRRASSTCRVPTRSRPTRPSRTARRVGLDDDRPRPGARRRRRPASATPTATSPAAHADRVDPRPWSSRRATRWLGDGDLGGDGAGAVATSAGPGIASMAIAAVDIALWDLKARLLGLPLATLLDAARPRPDLRQRRLHLLLRRAARRAARRLGGAGHPAGEDEGRPRAGSRPRARRVARAGDRPETELFVDANGAYSRKQALRLARAVRRAWACAGSRSRSPRTIWRACGCSATGRRPGWRSRPASTATCCRTSSRCSGRRGRLPAGRRHPLRGDHRLPAGGRALPGALARALAHCGPRSTLHPCCARRGASPPRVLPRPRAHRARCCSTASLEPHRRRASARPLAPGNGLELKRADAERYAARRSPMMSHARRRTLRTRGRDAEGCCAATVAVACLSAPPLGVRDLPRALQGLVRRQVDVDADRADPAADRAGVAGVFSERAARTALPARLGALLPRRPDRGRHARAGRARKPGGFESRPYNLVMGPPLLAPGSLVLVGALGLLAPRWHASGEAWRATSAMRGTCRTCAATRGPPIPTSCRASGAGQTPQMHGRYPDYDVLDETEHWDELTRGWCSSGRRCAAARASSPSAKARRSTAFCDVVLAQDAEPRIPVLAYRRREAARGQAGRLPLRRHARRRRDLAAGRPRPRRGGAAGAASSYCDGAGRGRQVAIVDALRRGELAAGSGTT